MGRLIVSADVTVDLVVDPIEGWFDPDIEDPDVVRLAYQPLTDGTGQRESA